MGLKRLKNNLLSINNLRKFAGYSLVSAAIESDFKLEIYNDMPESNVLVLSPHPDDDIFGCGGALKLHANHGSSIKIVYLTDGAGGAGKSSSQKQKKLALVREKEARKAAEIVGANDLIFWHYQDGKLSSNKTTQKLLSALISDFKPDIIYAPSFLDPHHDHLETCRILQAVLSETKYDGVIYSYEIWAPIYANRLICIDRTVDKKELAILAHESQAKQRSYFDAIMGLNKYRAGMYGLGNYAEAFLACNKELYLKLYKLVEFKK